MREEKEPEHKSIKERFSNGELIPLSENTEFPTGLSELLKVA